MIKYKRIVRKQYMDRRLKITRTLYAILILFMVGVVIYDSFNHTLPFYYILFVFVGYFAGYIIWLNQKVVLPHEKRA